MALVTWVLVAAAALTAELMTGTFYLLALAAGAAAGAVAAALDLSLSTQLAFASIGALGGLVAARRWRPKTPETAPDIEAFSDSGAIVVAREGSRLRVQWRGTEWDARLDTGQPPKLGQSVEVVGRDANTLLVACGD